jgi:hypothetical protein
MIKTIRNRLPRFSSSRDLSNHTEGDSSQPRSRSSSSGNSPFQTPPPAYRSNISSPCSSEDLTSAFDVNERSSYFSNASTTGLADLMPDSFCEAAETECGIKWRFAHQGTFLQILILDTTRANPNRRTKPTFIISSRIKSTGR